MKSHVQVVTTPTADTLGTTLLLHFDNKRYLIGSVAEGTQRACVQVGARLLKVSEFFITGRTEWSNTGGLIGMILTLADSAATSQVSAWEDARKRARIKARKMGVADDRAQVLQMEDEEERKETRNNTLTMLGPRNLNHTLATARRYVFRKGMPVEIDEIRDIGDARRMVDGEEWDPYWQDENIKVWAMSISPPGERPGVQRTSSTSVSPRKRSIDDVYAKDGSNEGLPKSSDDLTDAESAYLEVKAVVSEMFNSTWRLDTLHETKLCDVKLPATIFVRDPETKKTEKYSGPLPGGPEPVPDPNMTVLVRKPWPGALVESLPDTKPSKAAVSYIIKNHVQRGRFFPDKARSLNVPQGPKWAQLAAGMEVQNDDGQTITPYMVLGPSKEGGGIAVIDLPDPEYIDALIGRPEWKQPKIMSGVGAVFWICGKGVATDPRLHAFMQESSHLEHIVSSPDYCPNNLAFDSAAASTTRLRQVDPDRCGIPVHDTDTSNTVQEYGGSAQHLAALTEHPLPPGVCIAKRGQQVMLEPSMAIKNDQVVANLNIPETIASMAPAVLEEARKAQQATAAPDKDMQKWLDSLPPGARDTEIITLGTGSALPSKYRNVSANLVRVPNWGNILLDCGENTIGQLRRVFTEAEYKQMLRDLRIISISHMHADHQLGTTGIIKAWYDEVHGGIPAPAIPPGTPLAPLIQSQNRLAVVSEAAMQNWLAEYSAVEDFGYSRLAPLTLSPEQLQRRNLPSRLHWFTPPAEFRRQKQQQQQTENGSPPSELRLHSDANFIPASALNLAAFEATSVHHCHGARAVSLTFPTGLKVSYSGDCRPSAAFARLGRGSTVCIHEATFDDELAGDAAAKNHSTTSEALGVAHAMRAQACVLTHFSQRYQKVPVLERETAADSGDEAGPRDAPPEAEVPDDAEDVAVTADAEAALAPPDEGSRDDAGKRDEVRSGSERKERGGGRGANATQGLAAAMAAGAPPEQVKIKLASDMKVCVAFDYMRVKIGDIGHLEKFTPALLKLFAEEEKEQASGEGAGTGNGGGGDVARKPSKKNKGGKRNN